MGLYEITVKDTAGNDISLGEYRGKVLLIVNTATACGFTPQYEQLEILHNKYQKQGFTVLDFPCNQFGNQAPGTNEEIVSFCTLTYSVTFPIFSKIEVNGEHASPLYQYLVGKKGFEGFDPAHQISALLEQLLEKENPDYKNEPGIKWNFTKFLIDRQGNVVERFEPTVDVALIEEKIKELL